MAEALKGRHALVTGGGTGVGEHAARALVAEGARVTVVGRREAPLEALARELDAVHWHAADVTDEAAVQGAFAAARAHHGPVHIAVANAGAAESAPAHRTSAALWRQMIDVNLTGAFYTAREGLTDMLAAGWGRVVFVSSTAGLRGYPYVAAYCAAKHGVIGMMRAMALEVAARGVTVNAVCPGFIDTPLLAGAVATITATTGRTEAQALDALRATNPRGELVQPQEVGAAIAWLCRPEARSVNGHALSISGGEV